MIHPKIVNCLDWYVVNDAPSTEHWWPNNYQHREAKVMNVDVLPPAVTVFWPSIAEVMGLWWCGINGPAEWWRGGIIISNIIWGFYFYHMSTIL
jgi:hypothetical protein